MTNCVHRLLQSRRLLVSFVVTSTFLAGCAVNAPIAPATADNLAINAEESVTSRAQKRVDLLGSGKYDEAYVYLTPSYRALNDVDSYRHRFGAGAKWINPQVSNVKCENDERCTVTVNLGVLVVARGFGNKPVASSMFETWVKEDGQWWYYQRD